MSSGGPQKDQDLHDQVVSVSPLKWKTEAELRAATDWNTKPAGGTTPYTLKGHFS
jgi:hypothetical protein